MNKKEVFEINDKMTAEIHREVKKLLDTEPFEKIMVDLAYDIVIVAEYLKHKQLQKNKQR